MEPQTMEQMPKRDQQTPKAKCVYNKARYEQNMQEIFKCRRERYRTIHKNDLNIEVSFD